MGIRINGSTSGYTELSAGSTPGNNTLTLPENIGSDGQFLKVGATGNLSFDTIPPASSGPESLTVTSLPVVDGSNVTATSSTSTPTVVGGIPPYSIASYQWQIQGAGGTNYVDVGTSATFTIPSTINDGGITRNTKGGKIRVRVTMQDSTPGTVLTSGFITSLALDITAQNIALTFPTTGTLATSSTTAGGFSVIQVNSGSDNDNIVHYSYPGTSLGLGVLTVVLNDGRVFQPSSNSMTGPCNTNVTSTYSHSGKQVAGVVSDLGSHELTVYTDGSVKKISNGSLYDGANASNSPVVNFGGQGTHGTPMFILEDGSWMWCGVSGGGATTAAFNGQTYNQMVPVAVMPSGVKAIRCAAFRNGSSVSWDTGHGTSGWIILGDDGYLYTADASNTAWGGTTGWTNVGTMAAGGAKRAERNGSVITDKFVDVGPYGGVGMTWGGQGFSACREDGQMWVSAQWGTFGSAWARYGTRSNYISAFQDGGHAHNYAGTLNRGLAYTDTPGQIAYFVDGAQASAESTLITPSTISGFADPRPFPMMSNISGGGGGSASTCVFFPRS